MKILVSWSSGKDSAWMLHLLRRDRIGQPAALLTTMNEEFDRVAMHGVRASVLRAQAAAAGLPLIAVPLPSPCSNEVYQQRMAEAVRSAVADGFTHVAFGDLFLRDVRQYREDRLAGTGLTPIFPLWEKPTPELAREMVASGLRARLTCIDQRVLPRAFAGRAFDDRLLADLPSGIDPCGERGEFHSCVIAGPMFSTPLAVKPGEIVERGDFVFADLELTEGAEGTHAANSTGTLFGIRPRS
jgi:uncharacterized protein (TIGR00290 family)